jgi:ABC-type multidrug transport system ATPase subunit
MKLCVKNLSFSYGFYSQLFDHLSFEVEEGECLFIGGANGSGKTTLLRILAGLQDFSYGNIHVERAGKFFSRFPREYLQTESNGLFCHLSALQNLKFWLDAKGQKIGLETLREEACEWGFTNLFVFESLAVKRFSTGMKKKLSLMRVFLSEAPVLLLDEPLNGLDEASCHVFLKKLEQLKEKKKIIILSSHGRLGLCEKVISHKLFFSSLEEARRVG